MPHSFYGGPLGRLTKIDALTAEEEAATPHADVGDLYTCLGGRIGALPGVRSVETTLTLREVERLTCLGG